MGANMARRLHDQKYPIAAIYDVRAEVAAELAQELKTQVAASLAEVTAKAEIVITVVTDDRAMDGIFAVKGDSLLRRAKGKLFVNCATVSPQIHQEIEKRARRAGAQTLEACMASSIPQARQGSLYLMCGGSADAFARAKPLLEDLGSALRYVGKTGMAARVKALVNMVMNINTAGLAEGLGLGAAMGVDLTLLREVFSQTGANSNVLKTDGEDMQNREHTCYFSAEHAAKDSGIALDLAKVSGLTLPLAAATYRQYRRMRSLGLGGLDKSGIAELTFPKRGPKAKTRKRA